MKRQFISAMALTFAFAFSAPCRADTLGTSTYDYSGNLLNPTYCSGYCSLPQGPASGSVSFDELLPGNMASDISSHITSYSFSVGYFSFTQLNSSVNSFVVDTDSAGNIAGEIVNLAKYGSDQLNLILGPYGDSLSDSFTYWVYVYGGLFGSNYSYGVPEYGIEANSSPGSFTLQGSCSTPAVTPEPSSYILAATGLGLCVTCARNRLRWQSFLRRAQLTAKTSPTT